MSVHVISWVLHDSEARYGERLVLLALADHADTTGENAYPSVVTLSREARLSERQVRRALERLVADGRIRRRAALSPYGTHVYDVVLDSQLPADVEARDKLSAPLGGDKMSARTSASRDVTSATPGRSQMSTKPSFKPSEPSIPPVPPEGGRKRDHRRFEQAMTAWGAEHFPGVPVAILRAAAVRLRGVGVELSPAAIREFAEQNKAFSLEPGPAISVEDLEIAVREAETERRIAEADR